MHGLLRLKLFDGLDNRRAIIDCFTRMGHNLPDDLAGARRAGFLAGLKGLLGPTFAGRSIEITGRPTAAEAYSLFLQVTAHLGVEVEKATLLLEETVRFMERQEYAAPLTAESDVFR